MSTNRLRCPECDRPQLERTVTELSGSTHGESFTISSDALICPHCGFKTVPREYMAEFALRIADAYREKHNLLTSEEIKDRRLNLSMSQQQFANYLGVGTSSVKRWELGYIQDRAMDNLMVLKTDVTAAEENLIDVVTRLGQPRWLPREWQRRAEELFQRRRPMHVLEKLQNSLVDEYEQIYSAGGLVA